MQSITNLFNNLNSDQKQNVKEKNYSNLYNNNNDITYSLNQGDKFKYYQKADGSVRNIISNE